MGNGVVGSRPNEITQTPGTGRQQTPEAEQFRRPKGRLHAFTSFLACLRRRLPAASERARHKGAKEPTRKVLHGVKRQVTSRYREQTAANVQNVERESKNRSSICDPAHPHKAALDG